MTEKVKLTRAGYQKLQEELSDLIDNKRPKIKDQLKEAREQGDLSENVYYDVARTRQAEVEGRILQIETILTWCEIIDDAPKYSSKFQSDSTVKAGNSNTSGVGKTILTITGYQKLQEELRDLIDIKRAEIKAQLKEAREQGGLSENADYDATRMKQAEVEGKIIQIEGILNWCEIIEDAPRNSKKIGLGSTVTIKNLADGEIDTYTITGTTEADPANNKISNISPLGEALIGKEEGNEIVVKSRFEYKVKILKISNGK